MLRPKKYAYKEFDNEKNSCGSKILHPHHNFSNGPSLIKIPKILFVFAQDVPYGMKAYVL